MNEAAYSSIIWIVPRPQEPGLWPDKTSAHAALCKTSALAALSDRPYTSEAQKERLQWGLQRFFLVGGSIGRRTHFVLRLPLPLSKLICLAIVAIVCHLLVCLSSFVSSLYLRRPPPPNFRKFGRACTTQHHRSWWT